MKREPKLHTACCNECNSSFEYYATHANRRYFCASCLPKAKLPAKRHWAVTCIDCGREFLWLSRTNHPERCELCWLANRQAIEALTHAKQKARRDASRDGANITVHAAGESRAVGG